ncbi:hypothetical protein ACET3Z_026878 [Daucus carota]
MDIDLNSSLLYLNVSDLMAHIAVIDNTSEKVEKLNDYVKELNAEMIRIKESNCHSPLCILILTEAIQKLEKEIQHYYKDMKANREIEGRVTLENGNSKGAKMLGKSSDVNKGNSMSSIQLGGKSIANDTTKQTDAVHDNSSGSMREIAGSYENPRTQNNVNINQSGSAVIHYQGESRVIIRETSNFNNVQHSSIAMVGLNFSGNYVTHVNHHPPASMMDPQKKPRLRWTHDLHREFMRAVDELGGPNVATPKKIIAKIPMHNLTTDEVKSHLQKCRQHARKSNLAAQTTSAALPHNPH